MSKIQVTDIEYDDDRMWFAVNDLFDIRVIKTDEGIVVDVFSKHLDVNHDAIATTYAYDQEALPEEDVE